MAKRTVGAFQLEKKLGAGGMGIVYLATYLKSGQQVALKVLSPGLSADQKLLARFEREIAILKKLKHPNIVHYYGGGKEGEQRYYAMELMDGGSLEEILKEKGRLSWETVIDFGKQICEGLEHAHNAGIVHRDLKPANLFLSKSGKLKLGDFGIARDTQATALTAAGKTVGTYAYMAPEQISGKHPISKKTDLYALGCVLYEMLTGQRPFQAETQAEMLYQHLEQDPPRVTAIATDCPFWLESIVAQLMEKDPEDRPYDALAVHTALDEVGRKVAQQASVSQQTVAGGSTSITVDLNRPELQKILGKKKKKKKSHASIYEQGWFLAACLVVLIGVVTWGLWPLNEEQLFARADALMQTKDPTEQLVAREKYLDPLLARFPEGKYAKQAQEYIDQIEMEQAQRRAEMAAKINREPRSTGERLLIDAIKAEQGRDRITALAKYRAMINLLETSKQKDDRPYILLAERKIIEVQQSGAGDELKLINEALRRAEEHDSKGAKLKADEIWSSIVTVYGENQEFERQVQYARDRRAGRDVPPFDFGDETGDGGEGLSANGDAERPQ